MATIVPKETMSRLIKDVKKIIKQPLTDNGIYYIHDDTDMLKGYALIIGPSDTPYFGGNYFFEFILRQILREYLEAYPFTVAALSRVVLAPKGENKNQKCDTSLEN